MARVNQHSSAEHQYVPSFMLQERHTLLSVIIIIFSVDLIFKLLLIRFIDFYLLGVMVIFSSTNGNFSLDVCWIFFIIKEMGIF